MRLAGYFFTFGLYCIIWCQNPGGKSTFSSLEIPSNARLAGLGGILVSQYTDDANLTKSNPASLNLSMNRQFSINFMKYYSNTYLTNTNFTYAKDSTSRIWNGNITYFDYGKLDSYDAGGNFQGSFSAKDFIIQGSTSKKIDNFSIGLTMGLTNSNIAHYKANSLFFDIGGIFIHPQKPYSIGMVIKNLGINYNNYRDKNFEKLPIDIQAGITLKPEHMPLRFNITSHHLYRYNISYYDPKSPLYLTQDDGTTNNPKPNFLTKTMKHFSLGLEAILSKNFNIRTGYNFMTRQELKYQTGTSGWSGFSIGAMLRIKKMSFEYSQIFYHAAGSRGIFTLNLKI